MTTYDQGDKPRITGTFTVTASGAAIDPGALTVKVRTPSGVTTTYTYAVDAAVVRTGTGVYYVDISLTEPGEWRVRFEATGTGQAAELWRGFVQQPLVS